MIDEKRNLAGQRPSRNRRNWRGGRHYSRRDFVRVLFKRRRVIFWTATGLFLLALAGIYFFKPQSKVIEQAQRQAIGENEKVILALRLEKEALIQKYSRQDGRVHDVDRQIRLAEEESRGREALEVKSQVESKGAAGGAKLMMVLALAIGGGIGVAFARERLNHSFTTGEELERHLGIAHLVSIPEQGVRKK
jgi:hypothetical protein